MAQVVLEAVCGELALDAVAGAAHTGAFRVAALNHKAGDDPVEDGAVIETLLYQVDEVIHRVGGHFGIELYLDSAPGGLDGDDGILHWKFPPLQSVGAGWARPWNVKVL